MNAPPASVPKVSAETAERLWRQFSEEGSRHAEIAARHQREAVRCFASALAFRQQMMPEQRAGPARNP